MRCSTYPTQRLNWTLHIAEPFLQHTAETMADLGWNVLASPPTIKVLDVKERSSLGTFEIYDNSEFDAFDSEHKYKNGKQFY